MKNNDNTQGLPRNQVVGFPSPAEDFLEEALDFNEYLIRTPAATFMMRAAGFSMVRAGILPKDILVIDRSLQADHNKLVIAVVDGQLMLKRLIRRGSGWFLSADNPHLPEIGFSGSSELLIWGVVTAIVRRLEGAL